METISRKDPADKRADPYTRDPVADHPVIKQLIADVALIKERQADLEQANVWARGMMEHMHERQEHILKQADFIVEWIKQRGDTGAIQP